MMAALALTCVSGAAHAQSCSTFMSSKFSQLQGTNGGAALMATVATNVGVGDEDLAGSEVTYAQVLLNSYHPSVFTCSVFPARCFYSTPYVVSTSSGEQLFSDRKSGAQPFNVGAMDQINLYIDANGLTTITLLSQGNRQVHINNPQCSNNILYGFSDDPTPVLYTITLSAVAIPG
jgi:hypothetical protein